jgi:2-C-methyl-D-erythritol 4-phosphate cytidylyltransferase
VPTQDDDPRAVASLGIVPVDAGEPTAPLTSSAFRELRGRPLLQWAITALTASDAVRRVVVTVPPNLEAAARHAVARTAPDAAAVLPVDHDGLGSQVLAALRAHEREARIVVVHDPLHPLSPPGLVRAVVGELAGGGTGAGAGAVGAVPARPVTDTLKWVDNGEVVRDTADRERYRLLGSPQAYRSEALLEALTAAHDADLHAHGADLLPRLVAAPGGRVVFVPLPGEVFSVVTEDDLVLADVLSQVT